VTKARGISPFSPVVLKKAWPALVVIFFIFLSILFVAEYTEVAPLVILGWIILPVLGVLAYRKLRDWLKPKA
jgi:hypothetical protein